MNLRQAYQLCKKSDTNFWYAMLRYFFFLTKGKKLLLHQKVIIKGIKNIQTSKVLQIGIAYFGFIHKRDSTYLNIQGKLIIEQFASIGRGCRLDIGAEAVVRIGDGTSINPFTTLIIMHGLTIGEHCMISWNCQLLDDNFHQIESNKKSQNPTPCITIGDHVWIGSQVSIYKGSVIGKGSVVASNSVVKGIFEEENVLIAGNPAQIVKRNIHWR